MQHRFPQLRFPQFKGSKLPITCSGIRICAECEAWWVFHTYQWSAIAIANIHVMPNLCKLTQYENMINVTTCTIFSLVIHHAHQMISCMKCFWNTWSKWTKCKRQHAVRKGSIYKYNSTQRMFAIYYSDVNNIYVIQTLIKVWISFGTSSSPLFWRSN